MTLPEYGGVFPTYEMSEDYKPTYPEEPESNKYLYDAKMMEDLGGYPFVVGQAKYLVYGFLPTLITRSDIIATSVKTNLDQFTSREPTAVLPDDANFGGLEPPYAFKIVWNYLNGVYPEFYVEAGSDWPLWPKEDMTIEEKYLTLFYMNWFGINPKSAFANHYVGLFVTDLVDELKKDSNDVKRLDRLVQLAFTVRPIIAGVMREPYAYYMAIAAPLPEKYQRDMLYGVPDVPAGYKELEHVFKTIPPSQAPGVISVYPAYTTNYDILKTAKDLRAAFYSLRSQDRIDKNFGIFKVKDIAQLTAEEITGVKQPPRPPTQPLPGLLPALPGAFPGPLPVPTGSPPLPSVYEPLPKWEPSPFGLDREAVQIYFDNRSEKFLLVTVETDQGDVGLYQAPDQIHWYAPAFGITGNPGSRDQRWGFVRLFSA